MIVAEYFAVALAVAYLVLAIRQNIWCWAAAAVSALIYGYLFYAQALYMVAALQLYFLAMAAYGAWQWRRGGSDGAGRRVSTWPWPRHLAAIALVLLLTALSSTLLTRFTDASMPLLDSLTTWGSVVTTVLVARKILENWFYWFVIDALYVFMFAKQGMTATAGLFVLYLILVVAGYISWRRDWQTSEAQPA